MADQEDGTPGEFRENATGCSRRRLTAFWYGHYKEILIFAFFLVLSIILTWPLVIKFNSSIYGYPADNISGPAYTLLNTRASQNQSQFFV